MSVNLNGKVLCKTCFSETEGSITDGYSHCVPNDAENYPCTCQECGFTDLGPDVSETARYLTAYEYILMLQDQLKTLGGA